ncbi:sorbitol/mannitol transport ATP-binding protein [Mycetohabitans sp. B2]|uniref:sorbitol/mannitol transport ATP-binding protein n=1 Tax=Mycetohabitans sp. B2 TaxID=2841274 RepID=UPI003FA54B1F
MSARTMTVEPLANAAYLYAKSPLANDELIARILPLERHAKGAAVMLGADLDHCPLFDAQGRAFEQKWRRRWPPRNARAIRRRRQSSGVAAASRAVSWWRGAQLTCRYAGRMHPASRID